MPITAQPSWGLASIRMPDELAAFEPDVVGPLDLALDARTERLGSGADGERDRKRQQQVALVERAQDCRVEQRFALGRGPDAADCVPARRSVRER